jgi:heme exporter protein A
MIEVRDLRKAFGPRVALADVSLQIDAGEFVVLMGPNGAGKTTLLRILATLARPTSGAVHVGGVDLLRDAAAVRRRIGFLSHRTLLYDDLTAEQNLLFYARLYALPDAAARVSDLLARVGLFERRYDLVRTLSRGMQQRLAVARALVHRPDVLLLDEPYTGLDPLAVESLTALLESLVDAGSTILLTTHQQLHCADGRRVLVLHRGRLRYDGVVRESADFLPRYRELVTGAAV